jgi:hypothetical protein
MACGPNFAARFKVRADGDGMRSLRVKVCQNDACTVADVGAILNRWPFWKATAVVVQGPLRVDIDDYSKNMGSCAPSCDVLVTYRSNSRDSDVWEVSLTVAGSPAVTSVLHSVAHYEATEINGPGCGVCYGYELKVPGDEPIVLQPDYERVP